MTEQQKPWWSLSSDQTAETLGTNVSAGLEPVEAGERLERDGSNELGETPPKSAVRRLLGQFTDVTEAVQRAGYKTSAANFRTIVNATLLKSPKFKKVARGQYTAK